MEKDELIGKLELHNLQDIDSYNLTEMYLKIYLRLGTLRHNLGVLQSRADQLKRKTGASVFVGDSHELHIEGTPQTDKTKLTPLLELIPPEDLVREGAVVMAHKETIDVPDKWNLTRLKPFRKYGKKINEIIESCYIGSKDKYTIKSRRK